jgi:hypothetical protein
METDEKNVSQSHEHSKLKWHPAFLQAMQQELADYRESLEFKYEYQLTTEPLRIDLLIIKKTKNINIDKNIARMFKSDNLVEYKSPDDYLSVNDFLKVYAYTNLYAAITPGVDLSEITMTFIESRYPRKLLGYLSGVRGYTIDETLPGIYHVLGDYVPIQVIESKRLSEGENLWLKSLTNDLEFRSMSIILEEGQKCRDRERIDAYLDIILRANRKTYLEVHKMGYPTMEELLTESGQIPEWIERGRVQGIEQGRQQGTEQGKEITARNLLKIGMPMAEIAQVTELPFEKIMQMSCE